MFSINCLEITATKAQWKKSKSIYKNLLSENDFASLKSEDTPVNKRFLFNDFYKEENGELVPNTNRFLPDNFFGENINIQAIVGKNGSGKSTLMDLMYMAINNFAFMFERGKIRPSAEPLYFIQNLHVTIYFSIKYTPTHIDTLSLKCKQDSVWLIYENSPKSNYYFNLYEYGDNVESFNDQNIANLVENFFYSIVSNYSLQSFIPENYKTNVLFFDNSVHEISKKNLTISWINSLFHKNDSYIRSIVLNPFRGDGKIDLENEIELSKDRLTALLIWYKQEEHKGSFISPFFPYEYNSFYFAYKEGFVLGKIKQYFKAPKEQELFCSIIRNDSDIIHYIDTLLSIPDSFLSLFLNEFFIDKRVFSFFHKMACAYIIIKILTITQKYPAYLKYHDSISLTISETNGISLIINSKEKAVQLFDSLKIDNSHITKKLRRLVNFLRTSIDPKSPSTSDNDYFNSLKKWYINDYYKLYNNHLNDKHSKWLEDLSPFNVVDQSQQTNNQEPLFLFPAKIDECLPPSFFSYELFVNDIERKRFKISYKKLSSGEIQLLQTLSIHTYHLENIFSITKNADKRPKYYAINLVFDEIEICFHPEYQRLFVKRLVNLISSLKYNNYGINIILITHSPFILSDIPKSNVLFMQTDEDKENIQKTPTHTFAQNIGDMMYSSFFMEKTIGEFAEEKLKELIRKKQGKKTLMSDQEADAILKSIGDPVIRSLIEEIEANDD